MNTTFVKTISEQNVWPTFEHILQISIPNPLPFFHEQDNAGFYSKAVEFYMDWTQQLREILYKMCFLKNEHLAF